MIGSVEALDCEGVSDLSAERQRARRAAEREIEIAGDDGVVARELIERVAFSCRLGPAEVMSVAQKAMAAHGLELSEFERRALGRWAKIAALERPSQLSRVPAEGEPWGEPVYVDPWKFAARKPTSEERVDAESAGPTETPALPVLINPITGEPRRFDANGVFDFRPRLPLVRFDPSREIASPKWTVKGIIPQSGLAMILGEYQAGKSFAAIDLALHIAWGLPFMGRKVRQGAVVYVAAEGGMMVHHRLSVAERALQGRIGAENMTRQLRGEPALTRAPILLIPTAPNLSRDGDPRPLEATVEDARQEIEAAGYGMGAVVLDTLHAAMAGAEENAASDAGHVLTPLRGIADRHETAVIVVHHLGKDAERGSRGSNAFPAAMDAILEIRVPGHEGPKPKPASAVRTVTATKVRDADAGATFSFRLATVEVGRDEDGDAVTSCYVEPVVEPKLDGEGLSNLDREFMAVVEAHMKGGRCSVFEARAAWMESHRKGKADTARRYFNRAKENALKTGRLTIDPEERWFALPE